MTRKLLFWDENQHGPIELDSDNIVGRTKGTGIILCKDSKVVGYVDIAGRIHDDDG